MTPLRTTLRAVAAAALLAGTLSGPTSASATAGGPGAADEAQPTPLSVVMTSLSPSTIPQRGAVTISGVVANGSHEEWTDINVAPFLSRSPITTRDGLAEAAGSDPSAAVGERLTDPGTYVSVGDLQPGERAAFTIRVPSSSLHISGDPGVYWIGVHALGSNREGRDLRADGRARTFIPLVPRKLARRRNVDVSVVLPLRARARRASDGSLNGPARWVTLTGPQGRLSRLVDFAASAGSDPLTWLVDPAVLDALEDFGHGNPPLSLGPGERSGESGSPGDASSAPPKGSPSPSASPTPISGTPTEEQQQQATSVLERFLATARTHPLLSLGYADPDVASLARRRAFLLRRAEDLSSRSLRARGLTAEPTVAPPRGYFDPDLLSRLAPGSLLVLSDHGKLAEPTLSRLPSGQDLVLSDERAVTGGPAPSAARGPLALRQRLLAEAALEVTNGDAPARPVVLNLPSGWNPGPWWRQADFFGGLRAPWLSVVPLARDATTTYDGALTYGPEQLAEEVPAANVAATRILTRTSAVLGHLLANDNEVTQRLTGAALQASSYSAHPTLRLAADQVLALDATARRQLGQVKVTGTDFVTLSGGSGSLTVTLVNGLDQPVTVGIRARTDSPGVKVQAPDPVDMQPGERTTLRLQVNSPLGIHEVRLSPVTVQGEDAGTPLTFSLRTSQVGRLIWYIIIAGGVLLAVMIARRIVLRIRLNRWRVREGE